MISDFVEFYGISKEFDDAGYFETKNYRQIYKELKTVIKLGKLVTLSGVMGCGKTVTIKKNSKRTQKGKRDSRFEIFGRRKRKSKNQYPHDSAVCGSQY